MVGLTTTLVQGRRAADEAERARLDDSVRIGTVPAQRDPQAPMTDGSGAGASRRCLWTVARS